MMEQDASTLSAYSVVLRWVEGPHTDPTFPMEAFTRAISHDIQGHNVLLQHIISLSSIWHSSWPSIRLQRRRLYVTDLKPRITRDLRRVNKLIRFCNAEVGVFGRDLTHLPKRFTSKDNITYDLLHQARTILQMLVSEINALPENDRQTSELLTDEILERDESPPCSSVTRFTEDHIGRPCVTLRVPELEAKQILMKKPSGSPTLVQCQSRCAECDCRPCRCWARKRAQRNDSVFSMVSMKSAL